MLYFEEYRSFNALMAAMFALGMVIILVRGNRVLAYLCLSFNALMAAIFALGMVIILVRRGSDVGQGACCWARTTCLRVRQHRELAGEAGQAACE